jgi:hypothetical protein
MRHEFSVFGDSYSPLKRPFLQVEQLEARLVMTTDPAAFIANINANLAIIQPTVPTSNIDANFVNMATQQDAGTFATTVANIDSALAAGTMTVDQATAQRNTLFNQSKTLLVEANQLAARMSAINADVQSSSIAMGGLKAAAYAVEVYNIGTRMVEIKNELATCSTKMTALEAAYPTMAPRPSYPTTGGPFNPGPGTPLPPAPPITPPAWGD